MVKFASALIFAALIAAPALASNNWDDLNSRDLDAVAQSESLFGRELTETESVYAREVDELFARFAEELDARGINYETVDLTERSKIGDRIKGFFKKVWHGIKKVASVILKREDGEEVFTREELGLDEVEARELDDLFERYMGDIEQRSPGFLHFMKNGMTHVKHLAHSQNPAASSPTSDSSSSAPALETRDLAHDFYISARDFDDILEERELDLELDLSAREFQDEEEMFVREFDDEVEEMFARDFEFDELD